MKIYMIVLDGAADRKIKVLGNKTPLEKANTPGLDMLAIKGQEGLITVIDENITPESDSGSMALLSYDPKIYYPGRGTLEGLGTGFIPKGYNYVAFRINFASYDESQQKLERRTARNLSDNELQELARSVSNNVHLSKFDIKFKIIAFGYHRGIVCFYSDKYKLSGNVSNTDPGFKKDGVWGYPVKDYKPEPLKCEPLDNTEGAKLTADLVNEFVLQSRKILSTHQVNKKRIQKGKLPANCILFRDGGSEPKEMPQFFEKFGLRLSMYGQLPAENAIATLIGQKFNFSKSLDLQLDKEFLMNAEKKLISDDADIVFIHVKGPDEPGHDNEPFKKVEAIEFIDKYFISNLIQDISEDDTVIVTCDHATPCEAELHSTDKVPLLITGKYFESDFSKKFDEIDAAKGSVSITKAKDVLPYVIERIKERKAQDEN